jgi:hypothetical protein
MMDFMIEGSLHIGRAGYTATIGFQKAKELNDFMPKAMKDLNFKALMDLRLFLPQFHYFADDSQGDLPAAGGAMLGEFGTAIMPDWPAGATKRSPNPTAYRLILERIKRQGFQRAYAWSYKTLDDRSWWTPALQQVIREENGVP